MIYANTKGRLGNLLFIAAAVKSIAIDNDSTMAIIDNTNTAAISKYRNTILSNYEFANRPQVGVVYDEYFQSEKYFKHNKEAIIDSFVLPQVDNIYGEYVSVHVRRTDYVRSGDANEALTVDYYTRAMALFPGAKFVFFSDDLAYTKLNFPGHTYIPTGDELVELVMMSQATDCIIANSSFSWWGAYLGNANKVVAPKLWFVPDVLVDQYVTDNMVVIPR